MLRHPTSIALNAIVNLVTADGCVHIAESVGSRRELVANCVHTADADATKQFRRVGVGGVYWALRAVLCYCCCRGEHGRFSVIGESSLRVDSVMEPDTALYTCRASNGQDFVDAHALLKVQGNVRCCALLLVAGVLLSTVDCHCCCQCCCQDLMCNNSKAIIIIQ